MTRIGALSNPLHPPVTVSNRDKRPPMPGAKWHQALAGSARIHVAH